MVTACPVFCCHCFPNAVLTSWYSSRVGSYETLSSFTAASARAGAVRAASSAAVTPRPKTPIVMTRFKTVRFIASPPLSPMSERHLEPRDPHLLGGAVRPLGAAVEPGLLVVGGGPEVAAQLP